MVTSYPVILASKPRPERKQPQPGESRAADWNECTRDPLFLLQVRQYLWVDTYNFGDHRLQGEDFDYDDEDCERGYYWKKSGESLTDKEAEELGLCSHYWETIGVFFTREEGEAWSKARHYRWGEGNFRIYCHVAEGELANILGQLDHNTKLTSQQITIMRHALGADSETPGFRNYFSASPGNPNWQDLLILEDRGLVWSRKPHPVGPDKGAIFKVTDRGQAEIGIYETQDTQVGS